MRVSYKRNAQNVLEIVEENNYYPFGMLHKGYNEYAAGIVKNKYKYNSKEFQDKLGLKIYDYDTRNYDPALGRWMNIDPLTEQARRFSPYKYALNNPVFFIDPDGMLSQAFINELVKKSTNDSETKWVNKGNGDFSASNSESPKAEDELNFESGEPPVNFFARDRSNFAGAFDEKNKPGNYQNGDGIFDVFGHGGVDGEGEGFFADFKTGGPFFDAAEDFDTRMSKVSPAYKKQIEGGFGAFTINLFICQSGSGNKSMAKKISKAHPNAKVVAFDGFVMYGNDASGKSVINGASSYIKYTDNKGYRVVYQNGKEISRMLYSTYRASGNLF